MLEKVKEHYDYLCGHGYEVVFTALQGSQNYGLDEYSDEYYSDVDTKSAVLPKFEDFCAAKQPISAVEIMKDELGREVHAEVKDIRVMFEMFMKERGGGYFKSLEHRAGITAAAVVSHQHLGGHGFAETSGTAYAEQFLLGIDNTVCKFQKS